MGPVEKNRTAPQNGQARRESERPLLRRPEFVYALVLFLAALAILVRIAARSGGVLEGYPPAVALFFFLFGLFTIAAGYEHPRIGYVSFDRVSHVASLLVLGPFAAAWVNGFASLIFPLTRIRRGVPLSRVLTASLNNSGMMALMVLGCGSLFLGMGGTIPLDGLDRHHFLLIPLLILAMQVVNEIGMAILLGLRHTDRQPELNPFVFMLEAASGLTGVIVAIVFVRLEFSVTALLLVVLGGGMLLLRQFARMRIRLEAIVDERTQVLREKTIELERLATRDQLTGLSNRRYAEEYLDTRIEEYFRYRRDFSIALIDLDHFKTINDEQSHEAGDKVLKRVATILRGRCRETDLVARYGGEEFMLCLPEADPGTVADICEQLRHAVSGADWSDLGIRGGVSMSAGVAGMRPEYDRSALINAADRKLYEAKRGGRNLVSS